MTNEASDIKAVRTFPYEKEIEHSKGNQYWLEQRSKLEMYNKHYIGHWIPRMGQSCYGNSECVAYSRARSVQHVRGEWAERLHSVQQVKWICEVMCSRLVSGLWAWSTECMSAELSVSSNSWNYCECSVFIINLFALGFKWLQSTFAYDILFTGYLNFSTRFTKNVNIMGTKEH